MDKYKDTALTLLQTILNGTGAEIEDEKLAVDIMAGTLKEMAKGGPNL